MLPHVEDAAVGIAGADSILPLVRRWEQGQRSATEPLSESPPLAAAEVVVVLRADQQQRWRAGDRVLAETYLRQYPAIAADVELALDLVYGEFLLREEAGERPAAEEYLRRFPQYADRLRAQLEVHDGLNGLSADEALTTRRPRVLPRRLSASTASPLCPLVPAALPPPEVDGYEIQEELGRGGMGVVYKAWDPRLKRLVALKMVLAGPLAGRVELARFQAEAEAVARLQHPNIVQIYEVGRQDGRAFLALEYVAGGSLADQLDGSPRPPRQAAALVETLARAVHYAHERGIVHRDLKPANILLGASSQAPGAREEGAAPSLAPGAWLLAPKITDFGLAKRREAGPGMTHSGELLGTPGYMAPEQADGSLGGVGPATDIHALGVILYQLLTGQLPFYSSSALVTLNLVRLQEAVPLRRLAAGVPRDLETICLKCLQKAPAKRYATAGELADDLRRFRDREPVRARPVSRGERLARWCIRNPKVAGLLALLAVVIMGSLIGLTTLWRRAEAEKGHALAEKGEADVQKLLAEESLRTAREAVREFYVRVSQETLLKQSGLQPLREKLLRTALRYYQDFLKQRGDDPQLQVDCAFAQLTVADILLAMDAQAEARAEYAKAVPLWEALVVAYPENNDYLHRLGQCYLRTGLLLDVDALGQQKVAAEYFQKAVAIWSDLARRVPDNPEYPRYLAGTYQTLGAHYAHTQRRAEAVKVYQKSQEIRERLVRDYPDKLEYQQDLAYSHYNQGIERVCDRQLASALASLEQARYLFAHLVRADPANYQRAADLAAAHECIGWAYLRSGQHADAVPALEEAAVLRESLVRDNPAVLAYRRDLAKTRHELGNARAGRGEHDRARGQLEEARRLQEQVVKAQPRVPPFQRALAAICTDLGVAYVARGQADLALAAYDRAIEAVGPGAKAFPEDPCYQAVLGLAHFNRGNVFLRREDWAQAERCYQAALVPQEWLRQRDANDLDACRALAKTEANYAVVLRNLGKPAEALRLCQHAAASLRGAVARDGSNSECRDALAEVYITTAEVQRACGRPHDAAETARNLRLLCPNDAQRLLAAARQLALSATTRPDGAAEALDVLREAADTGYLGAAKLQKDAAFVDLSPMESFQNVLRRQTAIETAVRALVLAVP